MGRFFSVFILVLFLVVLFGKMSVAVTREVKPVAGHRDRTGYDGDDPSFGHLTGNLLSPASFSVYDSQFGNTDFQTKFQTVSVYSSVSLHINNFPVMAGTPGLLHFEVDVSIVPFSDPQNPTVAGAPITKTLKVTYNNTAGSTFKGVDNFVMTGNVYKMNITVVHVRCLDIDPSLLPEQNIRGLELQARVLVKRQLIIPSSSVVDLGPVNIRTFKNAGIKTLTSTYNALGAQEYDVELATADEGGEQMAVINAMNPANTSTYNANLADSELEKVFRNNATRITNSTGSNDFSLIYDEKYLIIRIRTVNYDQAGNRLCGKWQYRGKKENDTAVSYNFWIKDWDPLIDFNRQYTASFAEDGKKKEVMSYFDGSLRNRQSVTVASTDQDIVPVIQEDVYDQFGRKSAAILPAPYNVIDNSKPALRYYENFNLNNSGMPYSITDITGSMLPSTCEIAPAIMSSGSGASAYYSTSNIFKGISKKFNNAIPDAQGYPFSITQYTPDNTGRVKLQGGVGAAFQPGTIGEQPSHTTKYYYGKPEQWELDQLFGNDVGYAEHYTKNMVIDPNGQVSLTYMNGSGKTIATALTGPTPLTLDALPSLDALNALATDPHATNVRVLNPSQFIFSASELKISASTTYLAAIADHSVRFDINIEQLKDRYPDGQLCSNCFYTLNVRVTDDCGNVIKMNSFPVGSKTGDAGYVDPQPVKTLANVDFNRPGEYNISVEFVMDEKTISDYTDTYQQYALDHDLLQKKYFYIKENYLTDFSISGCYNDCTTCQTLLGEEAAFTTMLRTRFNAFGVDLTGSVIESDFAGWSHTLYTALKTKCLNLQKNCDFSPCSGLRSLLLADVSPGGQYALYDPNGSPQELGSNVLHNYFRLVFPISPFMASTEDDFIKIGARTVYVYSSDFNEQLMVQYWNPNWATRFLQYHPEACQLTFCESNSYAKNWDEKVKTLVNRIADIGPILNNDVALTYTEDTPSLLLNIDPFFVSASGAEFKTAMQNDLQTYTRSVLQIPDKVLPNGQTTLTPLSLPKYIKYLLYCAASGNTDGTTWTNCQTSCRSIEKEWNKYRDMYMELKEKYYKAAYNKTSCAGNFTCQIGQKPVLPTFEVTCPQVKDFIIEAAPYIPSSPQDTSNHAPALHTLSENGVPYPCNDESRVVKVTFTGQVLPAGTSVSIYYPEGVNSFPVGPVYIPVQREVSFDGQRYAYFCIPLNVPISSIGVSRVNCATGVLPSQGQLYVDVQDVQLYTQPVKLFIWQGWPWGHTDVYKTQYRRQTKVLVKDKDGNIVTPPQTFNVGLYYRTNVPHTTYNSVDAMNIIQPYTITVNANGTPAVREYWSEFWYYTDYPNAINRSDDILWIAGLINVPSPYKLWINRNAASGPSTTCDQAYVNKKTRFPVFPDGGLAATTSSVSFENQQAQQKAQADAIIYPNCKETADLLIEQLMPGIIAQGKTAKIEDLRAKIIEVCAKGGDFSHLNGASVLPPPVLSASGYGSFGEAIKGELNQGYYSNLLNPWLINSPFPYNMPQQSARTVLASGNVGVCTKLDTYKSAYITTLGGGSYTPEGFYAYLGTRFGQGMDLTFDEFNSLLTSCNNSCYELLPKPINLPVFMDAAATGYITYANYQTAVNDLKAQFNTTQPENMTNYQTILTNFMNMRWGFNLAADDYLNFTSGILLNSPKFSSRQPDPYACAISLLDNVLARGSFEYDKYIDAARQAFRAHYIATCSVAKAYTDIYTRTPQYHYTLYYYDQADNLVRTVPPEGVTLIGQENFATIDKVRDNTQPPVYQYNGPTTEASKPAALAKLAEVLNAPQGAVEMWLFNSATGYRFTAVTTDQKYVFQAGVVGSRLYVDVYPTTPSAPTGLSFVPSTGHYQADISSKLPLDPFVHVVFQGALLGTAGTPSLYLNGTKFTLSPGTGSPSPLGLVATATATGVVIPDNFQSIKHLVLYKKQLSAATIAADAGNQYFYMSDPPAADSWFRFNIPLAGSMTTVAENTTNETTFFGWYPAHSLATSYTYNSTNQVSQQYSPDGGTNRYWYDLLSRLVVSQNDKQLAADNYSYTLFEQQLGRITEVGERHLTAAGLGVPDYITETQRTAFMTNAGGTNASITSTRYDDVLGFTQSGLDFTDIAQTNLRKRVAVSYYRPAQNLPAEQATFYSYDVLGNVKTLWQQIKGLGTKRLDYEFDQVSGKVNFLRYQKKTDKDRFYYQYKYDAENRLTEAWSGTDVMEDLYSGSRLLPGNAKRDAAYFYYLHGPLARTVLGGEYDPVQGIDYAYTLQGWLKGVNSTNLDFNKDISNDGMTGTGDKGSSIKTRDAFGFALHYYGNTEYASVGGINPFANMPAIADFKPLFNGNIAAAAVNIAFPGSTDELKPQLYAYGYDQLNRLTHQRVYRGLSASNVWSPSAVDDYKEDVSYDANGNIKTYFRNGFGSTLAMDNLTYNYFLDPVTGKKLNNRLKYISDAVPPGSTYPNDIESQVTTNYQYDEIGNLKADAKANITLIDWNVYGKIKGITNTNSASSALYSYNSAQQRVSKTVNGVSTYYVRDAQGNTLALYDQAGSSGAINWKEQYLYGSSRLGTWLPALADVGGSAAGAAITQWMNSGLKQYELTNHLGNVMATVTDRTLIASTGDYNLPDVVNAQDYYPFGMQQPGRTYSANGSYRYGFNGKENDNDIGKGDGNQQDYGMRIYDPRIGRFLSVDPLQQSFAWNSPYSFAENDVMRSIDMDGLEKIIYIYNFTSDKITRTKFTLEKAGPLGNGVLVKSNHHGADHYYYGKELSDKSLSGFKGSYEGTKINKAGEHYAYKDTKKNPTIGYGHKIVPDDKLTMESTISEEKAKDFYDSDNKVAKKGSDAKLKAYTLNSTQTDALYDIGFNTGPGKLGQFNMGTDKASGENFFFLFMGDGEGVTKRRFGENLLYGTGTYIHLDVLKGKKNLKNAKKAVDTTKPVEPPEN